MNTRVLQRTIIGVLLITTLGAALAVHIVSAQNLHDSRADRLRTARHLLDEALQRRTYFLEDLADMVGVHDDAAAAEFVRYAHVRGRNERAVVSAQWVRRSPNGKLVPAAAPDPNPGATPVLIAPADAANSALADAAQQQAAAHAIALASLRKTVGVSAPLTLANGDPAFYLAVPVQGRRYSGLLSKAESQSAIVGLVDARTFVADALGGHSPAFRLSDGSTPLAASRTGLQNVQHGTVPAADRRWTIAVAGGSLTPIRMALPWLILVFGFSLSAVVGVILGKAIRRRDEALQLADERLGENERLLAASRKEANTDSLTALPNRRALMRDLEHEVAKASEACPVSFTLFDLNGFKQYNDTFGHPAGDALLARLGASLQRAVDGSATAYRLGGDEFCVLGKADASGGAAIARRAADALSETGEAFTINCAYGVAILPRDASSPSDALRLADQRMYERKTGRASACRESTDVLLSVLTERNPGLVEHIGEVAQLSAALAQSLGLSEPEVRRIELAAQLHDVGKVAIPDTILNKPGPLDAAEWEFMRRHTLIGERIITAAPSLAHTAELVRSHHERFDGGGYPDGLRGERIPVGATLIAVCDAFCAMTKQRPYSDAITVAEALCELRGCSGSQFHPRVVQAFCELIEHPERVAGMAPQSASAP
jgi:diguanylate cyclase (GGDEF)-like protein